MRRFCQLIGHSISTRTLLTQRIRGVLAHQTQVFPQGPISFAKNADSWVQWKPFPGILPVAPGAGQQARIPLCLKKTVPNTEFPPPPPGLESVGNKGKHKLQCLFLNIFVLCTFCIFLL